VTLQQQTGVPTPSEITADDARRWTCVMCRAANPMEADACLACGAALDALLREGGGARTTGAAKATGFVVAAREAALLAGLFVLSKLASTMSLMDENGAFTRGRWIWNFERTLHLPSEISVQAGVLGHPVAVQALNVFYLAAHIGSMLVVLPWLFFKHREHYRRWRNIVVAFTGVSLVLQFISVAPPRLLPHLGFVDTAAVYHQSAYQNLGPGLVDQLSSMPSIHVGWAVIVAAAVITLTRSRWRWLAIAHPLLTSYAVVATANHFWLDGVVALLLVGVVVAVSGRRAVITARSRRSPQE